MGRRAQNKQGDPEPIAPHENVRSFQKKSVKRKSGPEVDESRRPAKKAKEESGKRPLIGQVAKQGSHVNKPRAKVDDADLWEGVKEGGSSEGWEDVDDLKAETKCVWCISDLYL